MITFIVEGSGVFPLDMLRRDRCWPATSDDAVKIASRNQRSITLLSDNQHAPNVERRFSFDWRVNAK